MKKLFITATLLLMISLKPLIAGVAEGVDVKEVQTHLTKLCFNAGPIDGLWGKKTEKAAKEFLASRSKEYSGTFEKKHAVALRRTVNSKAHQDTFGYAGPQLCQSAEEQEIQIADKNVCKIQELLSQQGYNVGLIDGVVGKKTTDILTQFYAAQNKKFDGNLSKSVIRNLEKVSIKDFSKPDGFSTEYKNHFNKKSNLRNKFFHDNIHQQKITRHFSDDCGVAKIICCKGPRSEWDTDSERVELELNLHPLKRQYEMEFLFRSNGPQNYNRRVLIAQFKGHTNKVNGVYPNTDPPVAVYATNKGEVSCVNFLEVNRVKYYMAPVRLKNKGYLTDGKWHHIKMKWKLSKTGDGSLCEVIVDGKTIISMDSLKTVPFGLKDRGSARIGPYRDNDTYIQSFYFDNWIVSSRY
ncbi:putative peptidoglycan-binding domain-containing protein [Rhodobacteraceae bacterium HIMB11]|nr:putative peptidoglycan-binding domain-containing protein [Rhodobacteraceae bacterium HIMB11]